jgi:hypothetical protein
MRLFSSSVYLAGDCLYICVSISYKFIQPYYHRRGFKKVHFYYEFFASFKGHTPREVMGNRRDLTCGPLLPFDARKTYEARYATLKPIPAFESQSASCYIQILVFLVS